MKKNIGIAYQIFEFRGTEKVLLKSFIPMPGNMDDARRTLDWRIDKLKFKRPLKSILGLACATTFAYAMVIRASLAI